MLPTRHTLTAVLLIAATLASGWLHGRIANRWGQAAALHTAADRLEGALPERLGPWQRIRTHELEAGVADALQCAAYLHGVYTNDQTGDTIVVAVVAGPAGPISVHTPEICYSAQNYEIAGDRQAIAISDNSGQSHTLWQVFANSRDPSHPNLRVLYGWSRGRQWEAVTGPRFAFAGLPVLYKLQVAGPHDDRQAGRPASEACQDFLTRFLAHLQARLVSVSRVASIIP